MNSSLVQDHSAIPPLQINNRITHNATAIIAKLIALLAFQGFNYATSFFALSRLLGSQATAGLSWAAVLAVAFCCIDLAGITLMYNPAKVVKQTISERRLIIAWLLAAGLNTLLTWHGISMAILARQMQTGWIVDSLALVKILPAFMTLMIWFIRISIIGSFSHPDQLSCDQVYSSNNLSFHNESQLRNEGMMLEMFPCVTTSVRQSSSARQSFPIKPEPTYRGIPIRYRTM
ncbi:MAG: hypothetical protein JW704_03095 [Anaerolineaceae bacterium]|nr:hypothetical protein [Anaerolineaceae bacterium]MBN2678431.1 hypothetical protein [Anaerolineaceae bacterium]